MRAEPLSRPWLLGLVTSVVVATIVGRGFVVVDPNLWDGQLFGYIGQKWLEGQVPYVELWDNKSPGIFALLGAIFWVFPRNFVVVALVEGLLMIGTSAMTYAFLRRAGAPFAAAGLGAACVGIACNVNRLSPGGMHTEIYVLFPIATSMFCFARAADALNIRWLFAAGASAGVAGIFSLKGLSPVLAQCAFLGLWLLRGRIGMVSLLVSWGACLAGVVVAWLPVLAYFALHGGLGELIDASLTYNLTYGSTSRPPILQNLLTIVQKLRLIAPVIVAAVVAIALGLARWWKKTEPSASSEASWLAPLLGLWLLADFAGLQAGGRNYFHYFLLPALSSAVAAGYLLWVLEGHGNGRLSRSSRGAIVALILGPMLLGTISDARVLRWKIMKPRAREHIELTSQWILEQPTTRKTLFAWDYSPSLFASTNFDAVTRTIDAHHLYDSSSARDRFGPIILADLRERLPEFVVDRTPDPGDRAESDLWYSRFLGFIESEYVEVWRIGNQRVFRPRVSHPRVPSVQSDQ